MRNTKKQRDDKDAKSIWFSADLWLHLMHPKIISICNRPITIEQHDEWLINRINSKVSKKDDFYILGDVSMANKIETEKLLNKINGRKHLILGNHDENIKNSGIFESISQIRNFNFNSELYKNVHIVLCHYPIASWDRKVFGSYHIFGHCHGRFENNGLSFDIGVDANNYYPLSLEEVMDKMTTKSLSLF